MPTSKSAAAIVPLVGRPAGSEQRIGRILLSRGLVNIRQLSHAVMVQAKGDPGHGLAPGERLGAILVRLGYLAPMRLVRALCDQAGAVNFLVFNRYLVEPPLARLIPRLVAHDLGCVPLVRLPEARVLIASADRPSAVTLARLARRLRGNVEPLFVRERDFHQAIDACYDEIERRGTTPVRLGEVLVRDGLARAEEVASALAAARAAGRPLGEVLIERGLTDERVLYLVLARQRGLRLVSVKNVVDPREAAPFVARLTPPYVRHNQVVPYRRAGETVFAVTSDPRLDPGPLAEALGAADVTLQLALKHEVADLVEAACRLAVA
jgi:hypothetical protein